MFEQVLFQAADTMVVVPGHMVFPPIVFGISAFAIMMALMAVTFSFRNMSKAHPERSRVIRHEPVGHPGQTIIESGDQH